MMKMKYTIAALAATTVAVNAATYVLYDGTLADKDPVSQGWTNESDGGISGSVAAADGWFLDDRPNDGHLPRWSVELTAGQLTDLITNGGTISMDITSVAGGGFLSLGVNNSVAGGEIFGVPGVDHYRSGQGAGGGGTFTWTFAPGGATPPAESGWSSSNSDYTGAEDQLKVLFESGSSGTDTAAFVVHNVTLQTIPEPASAALLGLGGLSLILRRRK